MRIVLLSCCLLLFATCGKERRRTRHEMSPSTRGDVIDTSSTKPVVRRTIKEREPNDSPETATPISTDTVVLGFVAAPRRIKRRLVRDIDWFVLDLPSGPQRTVGVRLDGVPDADLILQVMHPKKQRPFMTANRNGMGGSESIPNFSTQGGKIYLRVWPGKGWRKQKAESLTPYRLLVTVKPHPADFEVEPNEPATVATPLLLGKTMRGLISDLRDKDWFVYRPKPEDKTKRMRLEITPIPGVPLVVSLVYQVRPRRQDRLVWRQTTPLVIDNIALLEKEEALYITLQTNTRKVDLTTPYTVTLKPHLTAGLAEIEPNRNPDRATPLLPDKPLLGWINYPYDVDTYRITIAQPRLATITLSGVPYLDLRMALGHEHGRLGPWSDEGGVGAGEQVINFYLAAGTHFLRVRNKGADFRPNESYTLTLALKDPTGWEREPNDSVKTATPVVLGSKVQGYIHRRADQDYYLLDLRALKLPRVVTITLEGAAGLNLTLTLSDASDTAITQKSEITESEAKSIRIRLKPAVYMIRVADPKKNAINVKESYQLRVE